MPDSAQTAAPVPEAISAVTINDQVAQQIAERLHGAVDVSEQCVDLGLVEGLGLRGAVGERFLACGNGGDVVGGHDLRLDVDPAARRVRAAGQVLEHGAHGHIALHEGLLANGHEGRAVSDALQTIGVESDGADQVVGLRVGFLDAHEAGQVVLAVAHIGKTTGVLINGIDPAGVVLGLVEGDIEVRRHLHTGHELSHALAETHDAGLDELQTGQADPDVDGALSIRSERSAQDVGHGPTLVFLLGCGVQRLQ